MGNFDFEHRLVHGNAELPGRIRQLGVALRTNWLLMAVPGDALWWPEDSSPSWLEELEQSGLPRIAAIADPRPFAQSHRPVFWAADAWATAWCERWGFSWKHCDPHLVVQVNSRRFQTQVELELGVAPHGLSIAASLTSLKNAFRALPSERSAWVLKTEFGTAGRESRRGLGELSPEVAAWATRQFDRGLAIVLEPRLDRLAEASVHFEISPSGHIQHVGTIGCEASMNGTYIASRLLSETELPPWDDAVKIGWKVAQRMWEMGYWGPVGVDAMRYRDQFGNEKLRPIQDINARYTMGRLALNLPRFPILSQALEGRLSPTTWLHHLLRGSIEQPR